MRFERNSVSMPSVNSRKIPTAQGLSVGNFRLAENLQQSDKSAMTTIDQIRARIQRAMNAANEGPITLAEALGLERNHVRDFLTGAKQSLKTEVMMSLSERYNIPFKDLVVSKEKPAARRAAS